MLRTGHAGPLTGIDLGLAPPPAHRLLGDIEFAGNGLDGLELRYFRGFHHGVQQPQRTLPEFRRILTGHSFQSSYKDRNKTWGSSFPLGAFAVVVDPRCGVGADGDVRCQVTGAQQPSVVAAGAFEIAADAPGVTWDRGQSSDGREAVGVAESSDVPACGGQELGAEDNAEAGHAQDNFGVAVPPISVSRVITSSASRATIAAASCCPGTTVCWDLAASIAAAATASALRALRLRNQAANRAAPARRSPSGV